MRTEECERKQLPDVKLTVFNKKLWGTVANNYPYSGIFVSYTLQFPKHTFIT